MRLIIDVKPANDFQKKVIVNALEGIAKKLALYIAECSSKNEVATSLTVEED
jgi:hypothetical protein